MRRFLHITSLALALIFLGVSRDYPPSAEGQSAPALEAHIESTDHSVTVNTDRIVANWNAISDIRREVDADHTDLAVLEGKLGLLTTIGGAILLAVLGNLAITWKGKKQS